MAQAYKPKTVEDIIKGTAFPKAPLTKAEKLLIVRENEKIVDGRHNRSVDDYKSKVVKPYIEMMETSWDSSKVMDADIFKRLLDDNKNISARHPIARRQPAATKLIPPDLSASTCGKEWSHGPPYRGGIPDHEELTQSLGIDGNPGYWPATARFVRPDEGTIEAGVVIGRDPLLGDIFPSHPSERESQTNHIKATLKHEDAFPQGPLDKPYHVNVAVDVLLPGPCLGLGIHSPNAREASAWAIGKMYLTLWGWPPVYPGFGPYYTEDENVFIDYFHGYLPGCDRDHYEGVFTLSASLPLGAGAPYIGIFVDVRLSVGLTWPIDDTSKGPNLAGVNLRSSPKGMWTMGCPGGPIFVPNMRFCLRPVFADVVFPG